MTFLDYFAHQHISGVLRNTFSCADESDIAFSAEKCDYSDVCAVLNVKGAGVEKNFLLVKIPKHLDVPGQQQQQNSKVLHPVFIIENNNNEYYAAFDNQHEMEHLLSPKENDLECLNKILLNLAQHQASELASNEDVLKHSEYKLKDITDTVTSLDFFKDVPKKLINESIDGLQSDLNKLLEASKLLTRSIGCPFAKNIYVNKEFSKVIFLNMPSTKIVPPAYDALLYIFALSDEKFRQQHFENLIIHYFESLIKSLHRLQSNLADMITRSYSEPQVKVLLPVVKFERVSSLLKLKNPPTCEGILSNLLHFLKFPLINQEDIYEATKNKTGSSDYDLLDYSLVSLSEKNGHLGEYFHLDIQIKAQGEKQTLALFTKILRVSTDFMREIIESGPGKKEDFFYRTLVPLYIKHGLESFLDFAPRCYLSRINWLLILDDLSRQGYVGLKPNTVLSYEGLKTSVINLAKFHSCAIILEEILSKESGRIVRLDQEYEEFLEESLLIYEDDHPLKAMYDNTMEALFYIADKFPEVTKKLNLSSEKLNLLLKKAFLAVFSKVKNSNMIRRVINHGDMYVANMLFKFGKDKEITEGKLIDFQLFRYVTPNYDLLFFLFLNSTKETRDKYLNTLIEEYYNCVSENIKTFKFDPEAVFPRKSFDENVKYMMPVGPVSAFMYAHVIHIDSDFREEIFHDQKKTDYYLNDHKNELVDISWNNEHYRNILKGLIEDIVDKMDK